MTESDKKTIQGLVPEKYKLCFWDVKSSLEKGEKSFPFIQTRFYRKNQAFVAFLSGVGSLVLNYLWSGLLKQFY